MAASLAKTAHEAYSSLCEPGHAQSNCISRHPRDTHRLVVLIALSCGPNGVVSGPFWRHESDYDTLGRLRIQIVQIREHKPDASANVNDPSPTL